MKYADDLALVAAGHKDAGRVLYIYGHVGQFGFVAFEEREESNRVRAELLEYLMVDGPALFALRRARQYGYARAAAPAAFEKISEKKLLLKFIFRAPYQHQRAGTCGGQLFSWHARFTLLQPLPNRRASQPAFGV